MGCFGLGCKETPSAHLKNKKFDERDANNSDPEAYTSYWNGFPLFLAGEGKNRAQLHRKRAAIPPLKGLV